MSRLFRKAVFDPSFVKRINTRCINTAADPLRAQDEGQETDSSGGTYSISKAMSSYLLRAKEHDAFMSSQEEEFKLGRRHLANMMGKDPETFNQKDINEAIRYLFPSGLTNEKAKPIMKPPMEVYPKQKSAQFDITGRPHHPFFYTAKPCFFYLVHEVTNKINRLNAMYKPEPVEPKDENASYLKGTKWLKKEELEEKMLEKLSDQEYEDWIVTMDRLSNHKYFEQEMDFLKAYRVPLASLSINREAHPILILPDGRKSVTVLNCIVKRSEAVVSVVMPGTGLFKFHDSDIGWFKTLQSREVVISPLQLSGFLGKVDVEVTFKDKSYINNYMYGETVMALVARYGIAHGVVALGADIEPLRLAGYLTYDIRKRERKKPGHSGPRKPWTWKKR